MYSSSECELYSLVPESVILANPKRTDLRQISKQTEFTKTPDAKGTLLRNKRKLSLFLVRESY
jgi:hypothetical protein